MSVEELKEVLQLYLNLDDESKALVAEFLKVQQEQNDRQSRH